MQSDLNLSLPALSRSRADTSGIVQRRADVRWSASYRVIKNVFDVALSLAALPMIAALALALLLLNPLFNPGPVFFRQQRMGRYRQPFLVWKFRTMRCAEETLRGADDGVEHHRITPLGRILRRIRADELPNFLNVLRGEMSVIGPRPDLRQHAERYLSLIPHYAFRYGVRPGITGLAQVETGYAEGLEDTARKAHYDHIYIEASCVRLDLWIIWRTLVVVFTGAGAK